MSKLNRRLQKIELAAGTALILGILLLSAANVFSRYALNRPIMWADEISSFGLVWTTFIAISYLFSVGGHVSLTLLRDKLPPGPRRAARWFNDLAVIALFAVMAPSCVRCIAFLPPSPALQLDQRRIFVILPVSYGLIIFHAICDMVESLGGARRNPDAESGREPSWN